MPRHLRAMLAVALVAVSAVALPGCELLLPIERMPEATPSPIAPDANPSQAIESPIATMQPIAPDADPSEPVESPIATMQPIPPDADTGSLSPEPTVGPGG